MSIMFGRIGRALEDRNPAVALALRARLDLVRGEPELRVMRKLIVGVGTGIDVGANRGVYSYWLSRNVNRTIAIEPHPLCAGLIRSALGAKVEIVEAALSSVDGAASLSIPIVGGRENSYRSTVEPNAKLSGAERREVIVPTITLDSLELENVGFVKIDVEGHELEVLSGSKLTIDRDLPTVLIEAEERHRPGVVPEIVEFFASRGYLGFFLFRGRTMSVAGFEQNVHQAPPEGVGPRPDDYANNFFFVHESRREALQIVSGKRE